MHDFYGKSQQLYYWDNENVSYAKVTEYQGWVSLKQSMDGTFKDPMIGLKSEFPETRKSYAFHQSFKAD